MMKREVRTLVAGTGALACLLMPVAADVADWTFEEAAGTRLMEVADAVAGAGFAVNGNGIATTGDGHLLVRRGLRGAANYYAPLAAAVDGPVWLLAEVDGWHLLGDDDAGEELMIGLAGGSPRAWFRVADMRLRRSAADAVTLSAESDGLDASRGGAPVVLANPSRGPLSLALFHDPGARRFEGWLREGGEGEWRRFARGRTSPGRTAGAVRLRVVNRFNDADVEHLRLSRLRVTKEGPLPNPVVAERSGLLEAWAFDDPAGTGLAGLANTAGAAAFAGNGHGIATTGEGVLRLRRGRRGGALYHAAFEPAPDESLWLVAQIDGWDLRGEPGEAVRFGFTNDADPRTWIDMRLERTEDGVVILEGRAGGPGASGIEARPLFANPQHGPLTLALNHDVTRQIYRIYHRAGDAGDWKLLGTGAADHTRHPTGVRLNVVNRFDDEDGERFDIASLRVTTTPPMADPDGLMETPFLTAWSWAAADAANGEILVAHEADVPRKSASITKAMTAMLLCEMAAENPELWEEVVDVSALAAATRGSSANLAEGDQVKVRDLVYGLMLPSGNDAGNAIAEHFHPRLAPPEDPSRLPNLPTRVNFLAEMNRRAAALGMESTFYRSAFGDGGTVDDRTTTAADLLRLGRHALTVEAFGYICGAAFYDGQVVHADGSVGMKRWRNSNQFLHGGDPFVTGIKTGTTGNAKACLLVSRATDDGRGLLMVVLGSDGSIRRYHDLRGLFAWLDAGRN